MVCVKIQLQGTVLLLVSARSEESVGERRLQMPQVVKEA